MPNGLNNWNYKDVKGFLEQHGFVFLKQLPGSHEHWISADKTKLVNINVTRSSYPLRTLETMIRQSGIDKKDWRNWQG